MTGKAPGWRDSLLRFGAWLLSLLLVIADIFVAVRTVLVVMIWLGAQREAAIRARGEIVYDIFGFTAEAVTLGAILVFACVGLALVVAFEYYYRRAESTGELLRRAARVLGALVAFGVLGLAVQGVL
ncbi:MAG: hypothetical protein K6V36_04850 [Anaerolineae bacterium]|nr:hypothetical protein [Anaerolineae bacterium]